MKSILLVEDTPEMQKMIGSNLAARGYQVAVATSGEQGLALAHKNRPDLILLDIRLPGISGWEVLEALKSDAQLKAIPVFLMTASEGQDHSLRALRMGADWYITKPFSLHDFLTRVGKTLQQEKPSDTR